MLQDLAAKLHLSKVQFDLLAALVILSIAIGLGFVLNRVIHRWTKKFQNTWGEFLFALFESLPLPLLTLTALYIILEVLTLPARYEHFGSKLIFGLVVLTIFYFPAKALILLLRRVAARDPAMVRVTQPAQFLVKALFAVLGLVILLENLGISLTAVWTTLGVGSVAVALALQDTLGNFFAGLYLLADRPLSVGDYIKLDSGQEGFVVSVGWRSTTLRMTSNNLVVIPNSTLAKAVVINYSLPEPRMACPLPVGVAYGTDPERVEKVLLEVAKEAIHDRVEGLLAYPEPVVRFIPGFGDSSLDFTLVVQVRQVTEQDAVRGELRKRILRRFEKEGIEMPFPVRTIVPDKSLLAALARPARDS